MKTVDDELFKIKEKFVGPMFYFNGIIINKGSQNPFKIGDIIEVRNDYTTDKNGNKLFGYGYKINGNLFGYHGFLVKEDLIPIDEYRENQINKIIHE